MTDSTNLIPAEQVVHVVWDQREAVSYITDAYGQSVSAVILVGRRLVEAKQNVPHGEWGAVIERLPFSRQTANAYMTIAQHGALANRHHGSHLPQSWRTLSVLARMPADVVEEHIATGRINPDMTRGDAQTLVDEWKAPDPVVLAEFKTAARCAYGLQGFLAPERHAMIAAFPWRASADIYPPIDAQMIRDAITALTDMLASIEGNQP